ncbi:hypothetical protein ACJVDH_05875 [Pedobacter sp. AW1-32]|uniref:hypothetical protein n=1 Tax=Pedobacter sp. AW1-32 TaxID=3383026 RepID=UPI003FEF202F
MNKELEKLKNKCLLFNQFMIEKGGFPIQMQSSFVECNMLINEAYANRNNKLIKAMSADIDEQISRHMPLSMVLELQAYVLTLDFGSVEEVKLKEIDKIIKRGRISGSGEYDLVINFVDEIHNDLARADEVNVLNGLLLKFDANK